MPEFQIKKSSKVYDVCIVGSGAGGGMAAKTLTEAGLNVVMLEAGPLFDAALGDMFKWPYDSPRRGASTPNRSFGQFDAALGGWEIDGEPYTQAPGTQFKWFRSRMLGGRTNHWGRISLRFSERDFKHKSVDGLGDDWPIGYEDVKPYYDRIDKMIGIFGTREGLPNEPDGYFLPPPKPRVHELMIKKACDDLDIMIIPSRLSILTRPLGGRASCHYCAQCHRGCSTGSNFSSTTVLIKPASRTGNLEIIPNAMVREVLTNSEGLATGVSYVHKVDLQEYQVKAKVVVLAASACESARLLLNSKSPQHPGGLANGSGVLGKYLHDSTGSSMSAIVPKLMKSPRYNEDGVQGMHLYMPWWLDNKKLDFPRGYHIEIGGGMRLPRYGFGWGMERQDWNALIGENAAASHPKGPGGYGENLKADYRELYGASVYFSGRGECIAREDNYCEIDPNTVDKFGIPVLRFRYSWSDHEIKQAKHMQDTFEQIVHQMGAVMVGNKKDKNSNYGLLQPGMIIHEVGTVRMGNDRKKAALNKYNQAHEVKNLFVVDGGPFVSQADKNPTWTILALSLRTSEYIIDQMKKQNI